MNELAPKDKRTKEYKDWVKKHQSASSGLGDTVDKITKVTGVKKAVKWLAGEDCGCRERQKKMNEIWRYQKPKCFSEKEFELIKMAVDTKKSKFSPNEQEEYKQIYERVFNKKVNCTPCSFAKTVYKDLVSLYKLYL